MLFYLERGHCAFQPPIGRLEMLGVTLTFDPMTLTSDLEHLQVSPLPVARWNSVPNLSEIEQSTVDVLQLQYLTLWPWTCVMCCALMWDNFSKFELDEIIHLWLIAFSAADTLCRPVTFTFLPIDLEQLDVPSFRLPTVGSHVFPIAGAKVWNSLSDDVTSAPSLSTFRRHLKTYLFHCCYNTVWYCLYFPWL